MKKYYACLVNAYDNKVGLFRHLAPKNMDEALIMMDRGEKNHVDR